MFVFLQYFHVNFGFNVELWDWLHGTLRQKDKIYRWPGSSPAHRLSCREDIFWGRGKDVAEASPAERAADIGERWLQNVDHQFSLSDILPD
jgi:hypothetical protein